jgi:tyrosine-protein kinase Etk/Wzc
MEVRGQGLHLKDYLNVLLRRKRIVLILFFSVFLGVNAYFLRQTPVYQATTTIQMENDKSFSLERPMFYDAVWFDEKWINTQVKSMKSRSLCEKVVKNLGLQLQEKSDGMAYESLLKKTLGVGEKSLKILPEKVNEQAVPGTYTGVFQDDQKFTLSGPNGNLEGEGEIGKTFQGGDFSFTLQGKGGPRKTFAFSIHSFNSMLNAINENVTVNPLRMTALITVTAQWKDPETAQRIANGIVEEYKKSIISKKTREASQVLAFIEDQLEATEKELLTAEEGLKVFKMKSKLVDLDAEVKNSLNQVAEYEKESKSLSTYRGQAEIILSTLKSPVPFSEQEAVFAMGAGLGNEYLKELGKKLLDLNGQKSSLRIALKEEHPRVQQVDREIETVKTTVTNEISNLILSFKVKEKGLQDTLRKLESRYQNLPALEKELFELERVTKVNKGINSFLLQKRSELNVNKAGILANVSVVDPAVIPRDFVEPNIPRKFVWALLLASILGVGMAFFLEYLDTTVKTAEQLQRITDLTFLGTVYHANSGSDSEHGELKMLEAPYSHVAEAFRTIKTNLLFSALGESKKFFLITSSAPQEGKTFITANLGAALAQSGKKVLIVETDLRNPSMRRIFKGEKTPGLTNLLMNGDSSLASRVFRKTPVENLELISAGDTPPNPSELLGSEKMDRFLSYVREKYDFVLFDSPPTFLTSDSLVLAQKADGVIFVARSGHVQRDILKESVSRFLRLKIKMLGVILNDLTRAGGGYYYYRYTYYYGSDGSRSRKRHRVRQAKTREVEAKPYVLPPAPKKRVETNVHS